MTERTEKAERDQADAPLRSAATLAGGTPSETPAKQRRENDVPLSEGAVASGAYPGGKSPEMTSGDADEKSRAPLDAREHFGGDGAQFVDDQKSSGTPDRRGTAPDDDGYDPLAGRGARQDS